MVNHAVKTFVSIVLGIFLFSVPLVLKYHVYRPYHKHVLSGEVLTVDGKLSTVWCQSVEIESKAKFDSFVFDSEPAVDESNLVKTVSTANIVLPNKAQEYWGLHLLRGSTVNISACSRLPRADVTVVKGYSGLKQCLLDHRKKEHDDEFSGEDSLSQSESDEDTSSISSSQGAVTNDTDAPYICSTSLNHKEIGHSYKCLRPFFSSTREYAFDLDIQDTDYYYFIFSSSSYLDMIPNELSVMMDIDRTQYNYTASSSHCSTGHHCMLNVSLASDVKIVLRMDNANGTLKTEKLKIACKPREWLFFIFYGSFFVVIFLCAFQ